MDKVTVHSTILLGLTGSKAYGTNTDDSDTDYRGIFIPDEEHYFGLKDATDHSFSSGGDNKNTKEDVDMFLSPIATFVKRCMTGSPTDLELLFLRTSDYTHVTDIGQELINHRQMFLSKYVKNRFGGYALRRKKQMMTGSRVDEHLGYNPKSFMHSVRMYQMGIDILRYGTFSVYRQNHEVLKELRAGKFTLKEAMTYLDGLEMEMQSYYDLSDLPETVDSEQVNKLLIRLTRDHLRHTSQV